MGCDIHGFMEVKKTVNGETKWVCADHFKMNPYYDGIDDTEPKYLLVEAFGDRNYQAFSQLCGVRSYSETNPKISEPRGIPDDVNDYIKSEVKQWGYDGHSFSHVTLRDVINFRKSLTETEITGMISQEQSDDLDRGILPESWCQWTNQENFVKRTWKIMADPLKALEDIMRERASDFLWAWSDEAQEECADNVRFVFFFDN